MAAPIRHLTLYAGLRPFNLRKDLCASPSVIRRMRTSGVPPMVSRLSEKMGIQTSPVLSGTYRARPSESKTPSNRTELRYRSPESGRTTTIVFPEFSGRLATRTAAAVAAPHEIPARNAFFQGKPSCKCNCFLVRNLFHIVNQTEVKHIGNKPGSDALNAMAPGLSSCQRVSE